MQLFNTVLYCKLWKSNITTTNKVFSCTVSYKIFLVVSIWTSVWLSG